MFTYPYPRPSLTADVLLFADKGRSILLIQRGNEPYKGMWAFPGGFFDMEDDDIEHTAARELKEETGLAGIPLTLACVGSRKGRDPRGRTVTVVFMGDVDSTQVHPKGGDDAVQSRWFSLDALPPLAFDHGELLRKILQIRADK